MPEFYLELSAKDQKEILQTAAVQLGRQESVLEKDVWVCWVLEALFSMPSGHPMAFKGGSPKMWTSLWITSISMTSTIKITQ